MTSAAIDPYGTTVRSLDRRFLTTSLVPTVVFLTAYASVAVSSLWTFREAAQWWSDLTVSEQVLVGLIVSAVVWFVAGLFSSNWRKIVRLYEGYPLARFFRRVVDARALLNKVDSEDLRIAVGASVPGIAWHLRRQRELSLSGRSYDLYLRYPHSDYQADTLPTTIGNILLAGERYGEQRYGFDPIVFWPRFFRCLPDQAQHDIDRYKEEHQLPIALSFIAAIFTVASAATVVVGGGAPTTLVIASGIGLVLASGAYLLAVERAEEYAEQLRAITDLYHDRLPPTWTGASRESDLADWYAQTKTFVLHGPDDADAAGEFDADVLQKNSPDPTVVLSTSNSDGSDVLRELGAFLEWRRQPWWQRWRRQPVPSVPETSADTRPTTTPEAEGETCDDEPAAEPGPVGRVLGMVFARVRALWLVVGAMTVALAAGTAFLWSQQIEVLVATETVSAGEPVRVEIRTVRRSSLESEPASMESASELVARAPVSTGSVIYGSAVVVRSELALLTLPLTQGTASGLDLSNQLVQVLIDPCGVLLDDVVVETWPDSAQLSATFGLLRSEVQKLSTCRAESATVLSDR